MNQLAKYWQIMADHHGPQVREYLVFTAPDEEARADAVKGPVTEDEWERLRRLRARHPIEEAVLNNDLLLTYPEGPWHSEDKRFFESAVRRLLDTHEHRRLRPLAHIAASKGDATLVPLLEQMLEAEADDFIGDEIASAIERLQPTQPTSTTVEPDDSNDDW